jgi:hypothetical protein
MNATVHFEQRTGQPLGAACRQPEPGGKEPLRWLVIPHSHLPIYPDRLPAVLVPARVAALFGASRGIGFISVAALTLVPQPLRLALRVNPLTFPPRLFGSDIVQCSVMQQAQRDGPFVARFACQRARLRK